MTSSRFTTKLLCWSHFPRPRYCLSKQAKSGSFEKSGGRGRGSRVLEGQHRTLAMEAGSEDALQKQKELQEKKQRELAALLGGGDASGAGSGEKSSEATSDSPASGGNLLQSWDTIAQKAPEEVLASASLTALPAVGRLDLPPSAPSPRTPRSAIKGSRGGSGQGAARTGGISFGGEESREVRTQGSPLVDVRVEH